MGDNRSQGRVAQEGLGTSLMSAAAKEFNAGAKPYTKPLYGGMSDTTRAGLDQTVAAANAAKPGLQNAYNWNNQFLQGGGWGYGQRQAADAMGQVANDLAGPSAAESGYMDMYKGAGGPSLTEEQLLSVARGEQFGQNAPGYDRLRQKALDDAMTGVAAGYLTNGRYGSSVMGSAAGEAATDVLAGMDYQNYQNDIARQERALATIEGQRQQGFQNQFSSLGASDAARLNQTGARMGALGQQFSAGQQQVANQAGAAAAMPGYAQSLLLPGQAITQAGQAKDADAQAQRLADYDLWERTNNARTNQIAQFASILQGSQGMPGTEQQTPWWQTALGAGAAVLGTVF